MSIRQYYQQTAYINLNGSILSAGLLIFILTISMLFSLDLPLAMVAAPFLVVCFHQYNSFYLYKNKSEESVESFHHYDDKQLFEHNHLLLAFAPAPALRMLLFTPDGMLAGEIREINIRKSHWVLPYFIDKRIKKKLGIYDVHGQLLASLIEERHGTKLLDDHDEVIGFYYPKNNRSNIGVGVVQYGRKIRISETSDMIRDIHITAEEGRVVSKIQKGWMPLEWTSYFKDANTPVLSFDYSLGQADRLVVFAALANKYMYHDH